MEATVKPVKQLLDKWKNNEATKAKFNLGWS